MMALIDAYDATMTSARILSLCWFFNFLKTYNVELWKE